jgi:hypothetical protein
MGFLQRGLLLYLAIAIAMVFAAPTIVFNGDNPKDATFLSWFNIHMDANNSPVLSTNNTLGQGTNGAGSGLVDAKPPSSGLSIFGFIDPIWQVWEWMGVIFKALFSPVVVLTSPSLALPTPILFVFVIPLTFMFIIGLIMWIRGVTF